MYGVSVTGEDNLVSLSWTEQSSLSGQLSEDDSLALLAEYTTEKGQVGGKLISRTPVSQGKPVSFELPDTLDPIPSENICLYIRRVGDSHPLVLRNALESVDGVGFRYAAWEDFVKTNSARAALLTERKNLENQILEAKNSLKELVAYGRKHGYNTKVDCDHVKVSVRFKKPRGVIDKGMHSTVAKKVCMKRLANTAVVLKLKNAERLLGFTESFLKHLPPERKAQFRTVSGDWRAVRKAVGKGYSPEIGRSDDILPIQKKFMKNGSASNDFPKLTANLIDAYFLCQKRVSGQLEQELDAWNRGQKVRDKRKQSVVEDARLACRKKMSETSDLRSRLYELTIQKQKLDEQIMELTTPPTQTPGPIPLEPCSLGN